jgi:hypothetical protein
LDENLNGFSREESQFHLINSLLLIEEEKFQRLEKEKILLKQNTGYSLHGKFNSHKNMLETMIRENEQEARILRQQQKEIQVMKRYRANIKQVVKVSTPLTDHGERVNQRHAFSIMRQLVQAKIQLMQVTPEDQSEHNFLKISQAEYPGAVLGIN